MTRKERTEYMRQWRIKHPDRSLQAMQRQNRKRSMKKKGWAVNTVTIFGIRCKTELYPR